MEMYVCELCDYQWSSADDYYEHLKIHSKEEVKVLKRLEELRLKNPKAYQDLMWEIINLGYHHYLKVNRV